MSNLIEVIQHVAQGVVENTDRTRYVIGTMTGTGVRCGDKLTIDTPLMTRTAKDRHLKTGDPVLCLLDSGGCVIIDKVV